MVAGPDDTIGPIRHRHQMTDTERHNGPVKGLRAQKWPVKIRAETDPAPVVAVLSGPGAGGDMGRARWRSKVGRSPGHADDAVHWRQDMVRWFFHGLWTKTESKFRAMSDVAAR